MRKSERKRQIIKVRERGTMRKRERKMEIIHEGGN